MSRRFCLKSALPRFLRAPVAALAFGVVFSAPSHALYKCGNTYQDKPCASGATESAVNPALRLPAGAPSAGAAATTSAPPAAAKSTANAASPFAPACGRIGQAAQQMVWKREVGATREKQLTDLPQGAAHSEMVKTLDSVYSKRGSAPEVHAAIESECLVEKQKQADTAALLKALADQAGGQAGGQASQGAPSAASAAPLAATGSPAEQSPQQGAEAAAATKAAAVASCKRLRAQDDALRADLPARGSAATMQSYNDKKRKLEIAISDAKC